MNDLDQSSDDRQQTREIPTAGRLIGIDFGTVRIGVAVCDENQSIASPLENYNRRTETEDARYFRKLADDYSVVGFVIGLPLHMSGDESKKSLEARQFGNWLGSLTDRPVAWIDERYSTRFANEMLLTVGKLSAKKRKMRLDKVAAQAILSAYLESSSVVPNRNSLDDSDSLDD